MNTIQVVLALTAQCRWDIHQLDVKNVFLHRALIEVHMDIGLETHGGKNKVCL